MATKSTYLIETSVPASQARSSNTAFHGTWKQAMNKAYNLVPEGMTEIRRPLIDEDKYASLGFYDDETNEDLVVTIMNVGDHV